MTIKMKRRVHPHGKYSKAIVLPAQLEVGQEVTLAGSRLLLVDLYGSIPPEDLLKFYEEFIAPKIYGQLIKDR